MKSFRESPDPSPHPLDAAMASITDARAAADRLRKRRETLFNTLRDVLREAPPDLIAARMIGAELTKVNAKLEKLGQ